MIRTALLTLALTGGLCAQAPPPPGPMQGSDGPRNHPGGPMDRPGPEGRHRPGGPERVLQALSLTKDQEQALHALMEKRRPAAMALGEASRQKEEALRTAVEDPSTPEAQVRALHAAAADARLQELLDRRAMAKEVEALLTPEQQAKAKRLRADLAREREARKAVHDDFEGPEGRPGPPR